MKPDIVRLFESICKDIGQAFTIMFEIVIIILSTLKDIVEKLSKLITEISKMLANNLMKLFKLIQSVLMTIITCLMFVTIVEMSGYYNSYSVNSLVYIVFCIINAVLMSFLYDGVSSYTLNLFIGPLVAMVSKDLVIPLYERFKQSVWFLIDSNFFLNKQINLFVIKI